MLCLFVVYVSHQYMCEHVCVLRIRALVKAEEFRSEEKRDIAIGQVF